MSNEERWKHFGSGMTMLEMFLDELKRCKSLDDVDGYIKWLTLTHRLALGLADLWLELAKVDAVATVETLDHKPKTIEEHQQTVIAVARRVVHGSTWTHDVRSDTIRELKTALDDHDAAVEQSVKANVQRVSE